MRSWMWSWLRVAAGADDGRAGQREVVEHVALALGDVLRDLGAVLVPQRVRHHPAALLRLAVAPGLLHDEELALGEVDELGLVELRVVGADRREPRGHAVDRGRSCWPTPKPAGTPMGRSSPRLRRVPRPAGRWGPPMAAAVRHAPPCVERGEQQEDEEDRAAAEEQQREQAERAEPTAAVVAATAVVAAAAVAPAAEAATAAPKPWPPPARSRRAWWRSRCAVVIYGLQVSPARPAGAAGSRRRARRRRRRGRRAGARTAPGAGWGWRWPRRRG